MGTSLYISQVPSGSDSVFSLSIADYQAGAVIQRSCFVRREGSRSEQSCLAGNTGARAVGNPELPHSLAALQSCCFIIEL